MKKNLLKPGVLALYFLMLLLLAPNRLPMFDTFYYWDWSRHLALSYYDGPPLIAYFIKISTIVFGDTLFALNFLGILISAITCGVIYRTARFFLNENARYVVVFLWLFSPENTMDLLKQTTYDTPLMFFWALTIYLVVKYIQTKKDRTLYAIGGSIGFLLLSKYSGVVLVLGLIIFVLIYYRELLKNKHFYFSVILACAIFSPVLYWNYQHGWLSFVYQLTTHQIQSDNQSMIVQLFKSFFGYFIPALNFMMLPSLLYWYKSKKKPPLPISLCLVICTTVFIFYLLLSGKAVLHGAWLTPYLITSAFIAGYCYEKFHYQRIFYGLIMLYACISAVILLNGYIHFFPSKTFLEYQAVQKLNHRYAQLPDTVITSGWFEARDWFFLKNKPLIYTVECASPQNQYQLWSADLLEKIQHKKIKKVLYVDTYDRLSCVKPYFNHCVPLAINDSKQAKNPAIFAYVCSNI